MGDHRLLRLGTWHCAAVAAALAAGVLGIARADPAEARQDEPSREELSDATPAPSRTRVAQPPAEDDGLPAGALVAAVAVAFGGGLVAGRIRKHRLAAAATREPDAPASATPEPEPAYPEPEPPPPAREEAPQEPPEPEFAYEEPLDDERYEAADELYDQAAEEPEPAPWPRRFERAPWPEAAELWSCEIAWKAGYLKSCFRAMAAPPGARRRQSLGESPPLRWTLMMDPEPPTPEMVEAVDDLAEALEAAGWERMERDTAPWYALRFLWRHAERPRRVEPAKRKAVNGTEATDD